MTFECRRCGKKWNEEGFSEKVTFYTLCPSCSNEVIAEWAVGITKVELQEVRKR